MCQALVSNIMSLDGTIMCMETPIYMLCEGESCVYNILYF